MRKYIVAAMSVLLLAACSHQSEVENSNRQRDSLLAVVSQRDSSLNEFITSFNDVQVNLDSVTRKQNLISASTENQNELKQNARDRIISEIKSINNLMDENRKKIASLNSKLKNASSKNAQFEKMVMVLNDQIAQKDKELASLNDKLALLNNQLGQLQISVDTLTQAVNTQTTALHTAYYVVGKSKDLQDARIIDRSGGVLGFGRTSKLSPDFDNSKFTRVDYTQMGTIPVEGRNVKIVTTHPADSYNLDKDDKNMIRSIVITDPQKFWSASKYLVVVKE